jgi:hypothetical protein
MTPEDIIRKAYYDPAIGFTGVEKLYRHLKGTVTRNDIKKFLEKQEIHQISKKNYGKEGSFVPQYPLYEFQIDLIYLENKHLNKASYGLVCIDTFTKVGDIELLKRKSAPEVVKAMEKILLKMGSPEYIYCDEGSEFNNAEFKGLMKRYNIELIFTLRHATIVERLNRTIKELLYKYLESTNSKTITNVLPKIISNYNNSYHKTIKMKPIDVNKSNQNKVLKNILEQATIKNRPLINVGDMVRVQLKRKAFDKGYRPKYSKPIFRVARKEGSYYIIDGLQRKYLRAFIEKVGISEKNLNHPDLEGTNEGHLKELAKRPISEESIQRKNQIIQDNSIPAPRPKRDRKKPDRLIF